MSDPIAEELNRLTPIADGLGLTGWPLAVPSEQVAQREGRELTRAERTEVKQVRGQSVRRALERVIQSPGYAQLSDEDRARELDAVIDRVRREGTDSFQEIRGRRSEQDFRAWYRQHAERLGLSGNP